MGLGRLLAHACTCGCVPARAPAPAPARPHSPFGSDWDYRAPETPPSLSGLRSRPPTPPANERTPLLSAMPMPQALRYRTSQVTMYLKHSASRLFAGTSPTRN